MNESPLPSAVEAEREILGGLLLGEISLNETALDLQAKDFYLARHRAIYKVMLSLEEVSYTLTVSKLRDQGALELAGGAEYISELQECFVSSRLVKQNIQLILEKRRLRDAIEVCQNFDSAARNGGVDLADTANRLLDIAKTSELKKKQTPYTLEEIDSEIALLGDIIRIPSSVAGVDGLLGDDGFAAPRLVLYAGYTGGGKTSVLLTEAIGSALRGHPVLFVSLELSRIEIQKKKISKIFEFTPRPIMPLKILDGVRELHEIVSSVEHWLDSLTTQMTPILVVDYAQKISVGGGKENRERQVALVAEELQSLGRRRNILIFLGAQLNRESAKNDRPEIYHVRESGLLEQMADFVILLQKTEPDRLKIHIAKHRWGSPDGEIEVSVDFANCTFGTLTQDQVYRELSDDIVDFISESPGKSVKIRDVCRILRWKGNRPTKANILAASMATGAFKVDKTTLYFGVAK